MQLYWEGDDPTTQYYIYMHFAEVVKLQPNQSRSFNITINGKPWYGPLVPDYLYTTSVFSTSAMSGGKHVISLFKTESSTLPPIINAFELYSVKDLSQSETAQDDGTYVFVQICFSPQAEYLNPVCIYLTHFNAFE